ncbi:MAG: hypothetical protein WEB53_16540 [Akkermansiaceae bacterium]
MNRWPDRRVGEKGVDLTLRVPRALSPGDSTFVIEYSSDLMNWVPRSWSPNTPFLLEARDPNPATVSKRFVRIRAVH